MADLIVKLIQNAKPTDEMQSCCPPQLWEWRYRADWNQKYYPWCIICDKHASDAHVNAQCHNGAKGLDNRACFLPHPRRAHYANQGYSFAVAATEPPPRTLPANSAPDVMLTSPSKKTKIEPTLQNSKHAEFVGSRIVSITFVKCADDCETMPVTGLPYAWELQFHWADGSTTEHALKHLASGVTRDVQWDATQAWLVKWQEVSHIKQRYCKDEWSTFQNLEAARVFWPWCHGLTTFVFQDREYDVLLIDKVDFTFAKILEDTRILPPCNALKELMRTLTVAVLRKIHMVAGPPHMLRTKDWHVGNVAFCREIYDDRDRAMDFVKCIDFADHHPQPSWSDRERMNKGIQHVFYYFHVRYYWIYFSALIFISIYSNMFWLLFVLVPILLLLTIIKHTSNSSSTLKHL